MNVRAVIRGGGFFCHRCFPVLAIMALLAGVLPAAAAVEVTTFGPQRFDRLKGAPTVYTETFQGCAAADQVLLQVWNGDAKVTRITAAEILVNGRAIFAESDFKKADTYLERRIVTQASNDLKIILKSGDYKEPSFLRIAVTSNGCDSSPPTISALAPVDASLLNVPRPLLAAAYSDGAAADASGIDPATVQLRLDGTEVTGAAAAGTDAIRYLPPQDLVDGRHTVTVDVADRAGNRASRTWSFFLDTLPPLIHVAFPAMGAIVNTPQIVVSGSVNEEATLTVGGIGVPLVDDAFSLVGVALQEGENHLELLAVDAAGNRSTITMPLVLDTIAPSITVAAPLAGAIGNQRTLIITGTVDDPNAVLTIDDQPVMLDGLVFAQPVELVPGSNTFRLRAFDPAGNVGSVTLPVELDETPPIITLLAPPDGLLTREEQVTISGRISESGAGVELNGTPLPVEGDRFSAVIKLAEGENRLVVTATDRAGNRGSAGVSVRSDRTPPQLAIAAPPTAAAGETLQLRISAGDSAGLTLLETSADHRPFRAWSGGDRSFAEEFAYTLSPDLAPGSVVRFTLRGLDGAGNSAVVTTTVSIGAGPSGPGYLQGEAYDDRSGLRLAGVTVRVSGVGTSREVVTAEDGAYLFELPAGAYRVELLRAGYTTLYRELAIRPEQTVTVLDARLTSLASAVSAGYAGRLLTAPLEAGPVWAGAAPPAFTVAIPQGALGEDLDIQLTPLSNQGLPVPLPRGWSPLLAFDLRLTAAGLPLPEAVHFFFPATLRLPLGASGLVGGDELVVARFEPENGRWVAQGSAVVASDGTTATAPLSREGSYVLLLADPAPLTPPHAQEGEALTATPAVDGELSGWQGDGQVAPPAAPPALGLRVVGEVRLQPEVALPPGTGLASGLVLRGRVSESFGLFSGESVQPSDFVQDLLLYRAPCLSNAGAGRIAPPLDQGLRTSFPITPSHQYTIAELLQGEVGVSIVPPEVQQGGVLAGPDGALLLNDDGIALSLPAGALERTVPVQLQSLSATTIAPLVPEGFALLATIRVDLSRQNLQSGALLSLPLPANFDPLRPVVLAQLFAAGGGERLRGVAFLRPVGSLLSSVTSVGGVALPGIRAGGTYCILQSESLLGLVRGTVRTPSSQLFSGALVTANSGSLADLSAGDGHYLLFAPLGEVHVTALDPLRFDRGEASGTLAYVESPLSLDPVIRPTVPSVVALNPENGAVGVDPAARITIAFSEPVERGSVTSATVQLLDAQGTPVAGVFSFSPDAMTISFYPEARLASEGVYRIEIGSGVRDLQGYGPAAPLVTVFTVRDTTPPLLPPAGSITATFPDESGMIDVSATHGSAEHDATVLIVNDTSGEIVSIASQSDGSFRARIAAQLGDEIQVVLVDPAGNRTLLGFLTFTAPDGRALVTAKGGKVSGEGGLQLDLPEGALLGPAVIRITPVAEEALPHPVPVEARYLGAVRIDSDGLPFRKEVKLSIPLPDDFPEGAFPFLAQPVVHTNPDGSTEEVYEIVDTVKIVDGRLTTASPPFDGVMAPGIFAFLYLPSPQIGPVIVSGITYRDLNGQPGYQPNPAGGREIPQPGPNGEITYNYDLPINGAVIRSPGGYNFIAYSDHDGHYASFGFSVAETCRPFEVTAIHPQTMFRHTANLTACDAPYIVNNLNFKLAEKGTTIPDTTAPVISLGLRVAAGQAWSIVAGTVPVGTELEVPVSVIDQELSVAYLSVSFQTPEMPTAQEMPMELDQSAAVVQTPMQDGRPALFRYDYRANFSAPVSGSNPVRFKPNTTGTYKMTVDAVDVTGNRTTRTVQVRAVNQGEQPASIDGAPQVDEILPAAGAREIMVTTPVIITFSEPLDPATVTPANLHLVDATSNLDVPVYLYTSLESGQMRVTLQPQRNLQYDHAYRVEIGTGIRDLAPNPGFGNVTLNLPHAVTADFTTKVPRAFDLDDEARFTQGSDIDLYTSDAGRTYAYVSAGINGWRVIDITDPTRPQMVNSVNFAAAGRTFRGVAVEAEASLLGLTEDIRAVSGDQFGYVRFYDLASDPVAPPKIAQEKLAEAYSGIPGRLDIAGKFAYIATINAGLQVVDIEAARNRVGASDGSTIVGTFDIVGQGYGHPNDAQVYASGKLLVSTNSGYLLLLSTALPQWPTLMSAYPQGGLQATRAAAVSEYAYTASDGNPQVIDLAVIAGQGQLRTVNISNPYSPQPLGVAVNPDGCPVTVIASDIAISKNAGLAFVSSFNAIQVFDIKDPLHPLLLQTIAQLPDEDGNPLQIGTTRALVEKDGWVYLANEQSGMRVLDFDPHLLKLGPDPLHLNGQGSATAKRDVNIRADLYPDPMFNAVKAYVVVYEGDSSELWKAELSVADGHGINTTVVFPAATDKNADQSNRYVFDANKRYYTGVRLLDAAGTLYEQTPQERVAIPLSWPMLSTDYNHDRVIDQSDLDRVANGDTFYFWVNDDDDEGETEGSDIPGIKLGLLSTLDNDNARIDGVRDLIDFFPVVVDAKPLTEHYPPATHHYRLKSSAESVKVAFPQLTKDHAGDYLTVVESARNLEQLDTYKVMSNGVFWVNVGDDAQENTPQTNPAQDKFDLLILSAGSSESAPVMLVEGRKEAKAPLTLEVLDSQNRVVFTSELKLSLAGVEQMFRHVNMIQAINNPNAPAQESGAIGEHDARGGERDRIALNDFAAKEHFSGFDAGNTDKYLVMLHGVNNDGQVVRGWHSELFKRLYWSGSRVRFIGVSWFASEGSSSNYQQNVVNAFRTASVLGPRLRAITGNAPVDVLAHSLGNMVASSYLADYYPSTPEAQRPRIGNYFLFNAAVALEAYLGDYQQYAEGKLNEPFGDLDTENPMVHPDWYGYQKRFAASEWYQHFIENDPRRTLTWRKRFANIPEGIALYSFYSSGEDVLGTHIGDPGLIEALDNGLFHDGRQAWVFQEKWKGRAPFEGLGGTKTMGWGFNYEDSEYNPISNRPEDVTTVNATHLDAIAANGTINSTTLKSKPFFNKLIPEGVSNMLFDEMASVDLSIDFGRDRLLAKAIPSLTLPTGGKDGVDMNYRNFIVNEKLIDMNSVDNRNEWPIERGRDSLWRHSDFKNISYIYSYKIFDSIVSFWEE